MANSTKNSTEKKDALDKNIENLISETNTNQIEEENKELKNRIEQLESQLKNFMDQFSLIDFINKSNKNDDIEEDIEVISLTNGHLILSTTGRSNGKLYQFSKQFESIPIPIFDLKEIVKFMPNTARDGYFYINNVDFVRKNGLSSSYRNILNKTEMSNIFNLSCDDFIQKFKNISEVQQKIVESMLINKILLNEKIDANILLELQKITGRNYLEIEPLDDSKEG